jgi:hypothetical protein
MASAGPRSDFDGVLLGGGSEWPVEEDEAEGVLLS